VSSVSLSTFERWWFRRTDAERDLHELRESPSEPAGIRCGSEWCTAFGDPAAACGDHKGVYAGLVHMNRAQRAEARDAGQPYEHGRLWYDPRFDEKPEGES